MQQEDPNCSCRQRACSRVLQQQAGGWENCALAHRRNATLQPPRCRSQTTSPDINRAATGRRGRLSICEARGQGTSYLNQRLTSPARGHLRVTGSLTRELTQLADRNPPDSGLGRPPPATPEIKNSQDQAPRSHRDQELPRSRTPFANGLHQTAGRRQSTCRGPPRAPGSLNPNPASDHLCYIWRRPSGPRGSVHRPDALPSGKNTDLTGMR